MQKTKAGDNRGLKARKTKRHPIKSQKTKARREKPAYKRKPNPNL